MFTRIFTLLIIVAVIGAILYGRRLIKTEKNDAVFGNPERAQGGIHWVIVGSSFLLLVWLYYWVKEFTSWLLDQEEYIKNINFLSLQEV